MVESNEKFGKWLYKKYTQWLSEQSDQHENQEYSFSRNMGGYCKYLNISRAIFSQYIHFHRKPTRRVIHALAAVYGLEVYSELNITPPTTEFTEVSEKWETLDDNDKIKILGIVRASKEKIIIQLHSDKL